MENGSLNDKKEELCLVKSSSRSLKEDDRFSKLPDEVISNILSSMPTRDAVKTCILSSRWRNLWKYVSKVKILGHKELTSFTNHVGKCLLSSIHSLTLAPKLYFDTRLLAFFSRDDSIHFKVNITTDPLVDDVKLNIIGKSTSQAFHIKHLATLSLFCCEIQIHDQSVHLPCLKTLDLHIITNRTRRETIENLISNSPSLESLSLNLAIGLDAICISHPNIKSLKFRFDGRSAKLNVPALKFLELDCCHPLLGRSNAEGIDYFIEDASSLMRCKFLSTVALPPSTSRAVSLWQFLSNDLGHVKVLELDSEHIKHLSKSLPAAVPLVRCTSLSLKISLRTVENLEPMTRVLPLFSRIEKLKVYLSDAISYQYNDKCPKWCKTLGKALAMSRQLKEVDLQCNIFLKKYGREPSPAWTLVKVAMENLENLEKLTVYVNKDLTKIGSDAIGFMKIFFSSFDEDIEEIQKLPRASLLATIKVQYF